VVFRSDRRKCEEKKAAWEAAASTLYIFHAGKCMSSGRGARILRAAADFSSPSGSGAEARGLHRLWPVKGELRSPVTAGKVEASDGGLGGRRGPRACPTKCVAVRIHRAGKALSKRPIPQC
jgi:hypothetical protein